MSKKLTTSTPLKRPSTRSLSVTKSLQPPQQSDKYTFQSDDEEHNTKPVFIRKNLTPISTKRSRGRPAKTPKLEEISKRTSISSSNIESDSGTEESSIIKRKRSGKRSYEKPVTRRASRLVSQTNTPVGDKNFTPKKRGRKPKMLNTTDNDNEQDKTKQQIETENIVPPQSIKRRYSKKKTLSTDTNPKTDLTDYDDNNLKLSSVDEKDLMQFGSPQHQIQPQQPQQQQQQQPQQNQSDDDFSDDSVEFVWKGSSKMSIEILKRRIPKDEPRDYSSIQSDPTAQRKRAIIPRLTNFDALSGQPIDNSSLTTKRPINENSEQNLQKKSSSVITLNNVFQNDSVPTYNDSGPKMTTTATTDDKPRPRIYAVKSTTMKSRPPQQQQQQQHQQQQQQPGQPEIKRPKWMNDQQGKSEDEEDEDNLPPAGEEPDDFDYVPKGQYIPKRPTYRGRGTYPARRGTGMRGRPPGSRRQWHDDDDDDDYDQYEEMNSRYGPRKQTAYRSSRPMHDMGGGDDDDYDRTRRMSLTQAYRRNNTVRPPLSSMSGQRRIAINNGNHPIYKPFKSSSYRPTPATLGLSTSNRRTSSTSRSPVSTISKPHHHLSSTISKHYSDEDYYNHQQQQQQHQQQQTRPIATTNNNNNSSGNTYITKMNDTQLNDVSNQSQIFYVNMPQQEQKNQQQVLSVLTSDQQQQQVLPVTVVQQVKLPVDAPKQKKILPKPSSSNQQLNSSNDHSSTNNNKPFAWSRPPGRIQINNDEQLTNKNLNSTPINTDLDTMEAAHVLATAADVTMAADARRKAQQHDDDLSMMVDETPSNIVSEETIQCDDNGAKNITQQLGTITANIIDENGIEHTVLLSTEEAQQLLSSQGAIIVDSDGQPISIQQAQPQTFVSPFALDQAQLQQLLAQAGIDPNTPLTIEQIDPNQQQQMATLCTSPGGTQYTVLTQGSGQQQFILQTTNEPEPLPPQQSLPIQPQAIAPKEELSSPPTKRRAFAVKSTTTRQDTYEDPNDRPRRKIFATKSTVSPMNDDIQDDQEGFIGTRAYHRNTGRK
ncbi:unnamed protein product [Adineta steineri]|uniref:Uncharacterized protein n=1 Tax=Adineta steineri TaxID=433720 RepID=A0A814D2F4_9BILA|nr:unnamed protein product [Adineta steineri]